jgi:methyltransferase (TIGR00027 family)
VDKFTNDSAMMIAYERHLESCRDDALFQDPFAKMLSGSKGETLSAGFGAACAMFELPEWPEFHKMWTAVRTKFIDDQVSQLAASGEFKQLVNCGAGLDTRAYRLECYNAFSTGAFEVDMEVINAKKQDIFTQCLGSPVSHCSVVNVTLDFLNEETTLAATLPTPFNATAPTVFVAEGLIMYLGAVGKLKLLKDVSAAAAPGSVFILQFLDGSESSKKDDPLTMAAALSAKEATSTLAPLGWGKFEVTKFGEEKLNFGRFPLDKFQPTASFSFLVCRKLQ